MLIDWFWKSGWLIHKSALCTRIALSPQWGPNSHKCWQRLHELTISTKNWVSKSVCKKNTSHVWMSRRASASCWFHTKAHQDYHTGIWGGNKLVRSLKSWVSVTEIRLFYRRLLQKRPIILKSLLIVATPSESLIHTQCGISRSAMTRLDIRMTRLEIRMCIIFICGIHTWQT